MATGTRAEPARVKCDDSLAQRVAHEPPIDVERRHEHLADRIGGLELAFDRVADTTGSPGRPADPEEGDIEALPQLDDGLETGMRHQRPLRLGVIDEARAP